MANPRVYCSGPLFNGKEREEMQQIAEALEADGFETFLPHRDGLEFTPLVQVLMDTGVSHEDAHALWDKGIFALDVYQVVVGCNAIVVNLNGRVPDEGAVSEAALAWGAGKVVVGVKDDLRSLYWGRDNPLLTGLFGFRLCSGTGFVSGAVRGELSRQSPAEDSPRPRPIREILDLGERLWMAKTQSDDLHAVARILRDALKCNAGTIS